jgi:hypothetical protein
MRAFVLVLIVVVLSGCAWMREDAGGDPATGPTRGQQIGQGIAESSSMFGPFAGIAVLAGTAIAAMSGRKKDE